jgi:hypothetical protein
MRVASSGGLPRSLESNERIELLMPMIFFWLGIAIDLLSHYSPVQ